MQGIITTAAEEGEVKPESVQTSNVWTLSFCILYHIRRAIFTPHSDPVVHASTRHLITPSRFPLRYPPIQSSAPMSIPCPYREGKVCFNTEDMKRRKGEFKNGTTRYARARMQKKRTVDAHFSSHRMTFYTSAEMPGTVHIARAVSRKGRVSDTAESR
jgi:hypothetical protein